MLVSKHRKKSNPNAKKYERLTLPFIEKYKDKIAYISKEGPMNIFIPECLSLNQSKVITNRIIDK